MSFFASVSSNLSSLIRLKRRFFRTSDPSLLTNNFNPALATGMRSELIFSESLNKMFNKLSTFSICIRPLLSKTTSKRISKISSELSVSSFFAM